MEKMVIKEKFFESIIGVFFIIPGIISVICFVVNLMTHGENCDLRSLDGIWGESGENTLVYVGIMTLVGMYMLKNNSRYIFLWFSNHAKKQHLEDINDKELIITNYLNSLK